MLHHTRHNPHHLRQATSSSIGALSSVFLAHLELIWPPQGLEPRIPETPRLVGLIHPTTTMPSRVMHVFPAPELTENMRCCRCPTATPATAPSAMQGGSGVATAAFISPEQPGRGTWKSPRHIPSS